MKIIIKGWHREGDRENPPRRAFRAVGDEVRSPARPATAGQTAHHIHQAALVGWESKEMEEFPARTKFNHANRDGVWGGSGQSGHTGEAIWMISESDVNTARGYAGRSRKYFVIEAQEPLKLAVIDEQGNQVFPDELGAWATLARRYGMVHWNSRGHCLNSADGFLFQTWFCGFSANSLVSILLPLVFL
jgi:hypothetical protein